MEELETLAPLDHTETDDIAFVFAGELNEGESVSDAVVHVEVTEGKDPTPALLKVGGASINPIEQYVVQRVRGRFPSVTYKLRCLITLTSGRALMKAAYLPVIRR